MNKVEFKIKALSRVKSNIIIRKDTIYNALSSKQLNIRLYLKQKVLEFWEYLIKNTLYRKVSVHLLPGQAAPPKVNLKTEVR